MFYILSKTEDQNIFSDVTFLYDPILQSIPWYEQREQSRYGSQQLLQLYLAAVCKCRDD